jgi:DNA-binding MarR family transcriptional regulator
VDVPEDSLGYLLWQTTITWQRKIKKSLEPFNISHAQFVILAILLWQTSKKLNTTQTTIANMSKLDKMTISKSLKKLSALKLVQRTEDKIDTRAKQVKLTPKGTELAKILVPIVEDIDSHFFGKLEPPLQKNLLQNLCKLLN